MKRKEEHAEIALSLDVQNKHNYWKDVEFLHNALPEINMENIDLKTEFFGKELSFPFVISGMTGGFEKARETNENLARAAEKMQIGFGVGSERPILRNDNLRSYSVVKKYKIPVKVANIGAPQLVDQKNEKAATIKDIERIIKIIDANFLAIHLNFLQEIAQPGGEGNAKNILKAIEKVVSSVDVPVIVKETGGGISKEVGEKLKKVGVACIDAGGAGGTSFSAIEYYRAKAAGSELLQHIGKTFWNWGIPTPVSLMLLRDLNTRLIATGGIRSGVDIAKAIALGADLAGAAYPLLKPGVKSYKDSVFVLSLFKEELKSTMFLLGVDSIEKLKNVKTLKFERVRGWIEELHLE
jgi:isopentenyl-diphosphate delta-isomerase